MKFSRLLKNVFYFSESKDIQIPEYSIPEKIKDFFKIPYNLFIDKGKGKKEIDEFKEYFLSDKVSISQLIYALDYDKSMTGIDYQKYYELKELEDDLKKDINVKKKDFAFVFFNSVINSTLIDQESKKNIQLIIDAWDAYGAKDQEREIENYIKKAGEEKERYEAIISDLKQTFDNPQKLKETLNRIEGLREKSIDELNELLKTNPVLFEEDPTLYDKRLKLINDNYDRILIDAKENVTNPKKLEENIAKIEKMKIQSLQKYSEYEKKASYIQDDTANSNMIDMARNIISGIGNSLYKGSNERRALLSQLVIEKQKKSESEVRKLSQINKERLKEIEKESKETKRLENLQSQYGLTKSKSMTMSSKDTRSIEKTKQDELIKPVIWDTLSAQNTLIEWEKTKNKVVEWWENLPYTIKSITGGIDKNYHLLTDMNKIFYRLLNPKQNYFGSDDVSQAAYDKMLEKSDLSLLPPSIIAKIRENKSKSPELIFNKISKVISDIKSGKLVPKEILEIKLKQTSPVINTKSIESDADKAMRDYISSIKRQEEKDEEKLLEMEEEEQDEIERQEKELSDYMKRMSAIASGNSSPNLVFQTFNNIKSFINKIKSVKIPNKNKNSILDSIELAIMDLDQEIIGIEDVISSLESARSAINK